MSPSNPSTQFGMGDVLRRNAPIDDFHNTAATAESIATKIAAMTLLQTGSCQIFFSTELVASSRIVLLGEWDSEGGIGSMKADPARYSDPPCSIKVGVDTSHSDTLIMRKLDRLGRGRCSMTSAPAA